jgi:plastocyanin
MKSCLHLLIGWVWLVVLLLLTASGCGVSAPSQTKQPPSPDIKFGSDRSYIKVGMCVVFTWEVENAETVYFYVEDEPWENNAVSMKDSREECRMKTTTYYLRVVRSDNTVEIREIRIPVESMPGL